MTDWANSSMNNIYNDVAKKMTQTTTYHLAATLIMDRNFPNSDDLPPVIPTPFNNFGHQLFLDYSLLLKIIWQAVDDIQEATKQLTGIINFLKFLFAVIAVVVFIRLFPMLNTTQSDFNKLTVTLFTFEVILGIAIYLLAQNQQKKLHHKIAKVRAKTIEQLYQETWHSQKKMKLDHAIEKQVNHLIGDGVIYTDQVPVLVIVDKRYPFPGYGPLLTEELFVCPPKKINTDISNEKPPKINIDEISETVDKSIKNFVSTGKIQYTNVGYLAVLHGKSLSTNTTSSSSPKWLDSYKIPKLSIDKRELTAKQINKNLGEPLRIYRAIQILFPEYDTVATFFLRLFLAENSASCHMAVTTIGPINFDINTFHSRWMKYRINLKQEQRKNNHHLQGISKVDALPQQIQNVAEFQAKRNLQEIMSLNYFKMAKETNESYPNNEYTRTLKDSVVWPGIYFAKRTMRERYSLTVTDDFFGKTEAVATIKSLYSQLGKIIIDSFAELEFDVSQYKDKQGNYTINASKIDQLFIGDQIQFNQPQPVDKKENDNTSINNTESRDVTGSRTEGTIIEATPAQ